ncbi:PKD domain-containing protein [Tahibacter soli]|uniref:PKD domain-containing protein n=1 Tax=Tahibacter soli TaxID=2983605 RepID=A0A9X4BMC7_9GAMM|nr:PKD domain-containing protein [Tahibacter soli]MDC8016197.1 PKD domain-containing protein [Tahibacter soli]
MLRTTRTFLTPLLSALILMPTVAQVAVAADPTGSMSVPRADHSAARLPDGRVLVMGGYSTGGPSTASAEFYDAATGAFAAAPPLVVSRGEAGVATLGDGRILIVGGVRQTASGGEFLRSAEIYDPVSASWSVTPGSLTGNTVTTYPTTVTLQDGKVLVIDGTNSQVFDPATGVFTVAIAMNTTRSRGAAALLPDGRVLLAGGQNNANVVLTTADIWDPATNTWSATGAMATARHSATATRLADGRILIAGGSNGSSKQAGAEVFDPATQTFSSTGALLTARAGHTAVALTDGSVLVAGGYTNASVTSSLERWYPATGTWADAGSLAASRTRMFTATLLNNGNVLFAGGSGPLATAEIYAAGSGNVPPVANFSHTASNLTVTFADASADADGTIASRSWNFGDGTTSTAASPVKTYAAGGTYNVTLSVTDNAGATNAITKSLTVGTPPNAAPTANFSYVTNGLAATFTDGSSDSDGTIVSRAWNFGDGTTSTATNPAKTYAAAGTYTVSLTVTDNGGATQTKTSSVTVVSSGCGGTVLCNGVAATGLAAAAGGTTATYTLVVPAGATNLQFVTAGGTGDADLYVKFGSAPTTSSYDCRPYVGGNAETCNIATAQAGTYYVVLRAYSAFSGVSLTGSYTTGGSNIVPTANFTFATSGLTATFADTSTDVDGTIASRSWNFGDGTTSTATNPAKTYVAPGTYTVSLTVTDNGGASQTKTASVAVYSGGCGGTILCNGVAVTGLSAGSGLTTSTYTLVVPAGATNLAFVTSGGTGDADLYVKFGSAPTTSSYDCRPYIGGNAETCNIANPQAGTYYVVLRAFSTFSGVSLQGSYTSP